MHRLSGTFYGATLALAILESLSVAEIGVGQAEPEEKLEVSWAAPDHKIAAIPFESPNNMILLHVSINGSKPLWFALDSGSSVCLLDLSRAKTLGLEFESSTQGQERVPELIRSRSSGELLILDSLD